MFLLKIPEGADINKEGMVYYKGLFLGVTSPEYPGMMEVIGSMVKVTEEEKRDTEYYNLVRLHKDDVVEAIWCMHQGTEHEIDHEQARKIVDERIDMDRVADWMRDALMNQWGNTLIQVVRECLDRS